MDIEKTSSPPTSPVSLCVELFSYKKAYIFTVVEELKSPIKIVFIINKW